MKANNVTKSAATTMPEYAIWKSLKRKCLSQNAKGYSQFGGAGKGFAARWQGPEGFDHFLADVGPRPFPKAGIELIDPSGNFELGNVRWADTRPCRQLTHDGQTMSITEWARKLNIRPSTLRARLHDHLPPEQVFARRVRNGMHMKPFKPERRVTTAEYETTEVTTDSQELAALIARAVEVARS
jgi:hypothetical protein